MSYREYVAAAIVVGSLFATTACSGGEDPDSGVEASTPEFLPSDTPVSDPEAPAAFHFESGDLVLGPFEPEDVFDNLFNPCEEITDAEFAAAGLERRQLQPDQAGLVARGIRSCSLVPDSRDLSVLLVVNSVNRKMIESGSPAIEFSGQGIPGAFVFGAPSESMTMCDYAVETARGTISASVSTQRSGIEESSLCPIASDVLIKLYTSAATG